MRLTTILFWQIALVLLAALIGVSAAAQWTAHELGYSPRLGTPLFEVAEHPIYAPWAFFGWWFSYEAYAPEVFDRGGLIAASGGFAGLVIAIICSALRARGARTVSTFGSSRWATRRDIRKAGLLDPSGVFLGQLPGTYLRHSGPEHIMAFAPTRSGKGVGLVVPTLLSWQHSTVVHDIKGENWDLTSGWRSSFSRCVRFDPTDPASPRFNPLLEVRMGDNEVRDAMNIADILIDPDGTLTVRNHWHNTAFILLVTTILHVLYAETDKSLTRVAQLLTDPKRPVLETLETIKQTNHIGTDSAPEVHPIIASMAQEVVDKWPPERSGVISTTLAYLSLYRDPVIARLTASSDWQVADLVEGDGPLSLYLCVPPSDISRTRPLMRLILNQIGRRLTEKLPEADRRKVLLMLDEFPALGRLDFFETSLGFMAGYGLRAFLVSQSLNQVEKAYGPNNSILDNCHVRVAFATNDERTARRVSDALGTKTELRAQKNFAGHRLAPWLSHTMVSRQETARQLLTPGEVMQLPVDDQLILVAGSPPIRAKKLRYYEDRNFIGRVVPPPASQNSAPNSPMPSEWEGRVATIHEGLMTEATDEGGAKLEHKREPRVVVPFKTPEPDGPAPSLDQAHCETDIFGEEISQAQAFDKLTGTHLLDDDGGET